MIWLVRITHRANSFNTCAILSINHFSSALGTQLFSGIKVTNVKYFESQPWPFPSQLMLGFSCEYKSGELIIDNNEIEDAFWVSKEDLKLVLNGKADNFIPARKGTIARYLLEKWVNDEILKQQSNQKHKKLIQHL